jgi:iron complex transport system substrate-binding protein
MFRIVFFIFLIYSGSLLSCEPFSNANLVKNKYAKFFKIYKYKSGWFIDVFKNESKVHSRYSVNIDHSCVGIIKIMNSKRIGLMSTTYLPFIEALDKTINLRGVFGLKNFYGSKLKKGNIKDLGARPGLEKILKANFSVLFGYSLNNSDKDLFYQLQKYDYPVFAIHDYLESSALGRVEWLKVFGLIFGKYPLSNTKFSEIETSFKNELVRISKSSNLNVLIAQEYEGNWFVPGENSYIYEMVRLVGGKVPLSTGYPSRRKVSRDDILRALKKTDVWFPQSNERDIGRLFKYLGTSREKFKRLKIYNITKRIDQKGSNDFWQGGIFRPDLVIQDLKKTLGVGDVDNDEFYWYEEL